MNFCFDFLQEFLERVFHPVSKHLDVGLKKTSATPHFFNLLKLLGVWKSDERLFLVFDCLGKHGENKDR